MGKLKKEEVAHIEIVCFDVDGVTVKKGTDIKEVKTKEDTTLTVKTSNLSPRLLNKMIELMPPEFFSLPRDIEHSVENGLKYEDLGNYFASYTNFYFALELANKLNQKEEAEILNEVVDHLKSKLYKK